MDSPPDQILVAADHLTSRLVYVCELLFKHLLGLPYALVTTREAEASGLDPDLFYTAEPPVPGKAWLQPSGWLEVEAPPPHGWKVPSVPDRKGFFFPVSSPRSLLAYDVFASLCWLAALGDHYLMGDLDGHGRCTIQYEEPVAHIAALELLTALKEGAEDSAHKYNRAQEKRSDWFLTIDVDQPWKHAHKGWGVTWGGLLRDLLLFRKVAVAERLAARRGKDPYEVYDLITSSCPAAKTTFFFLLNGNHQNDSRFFADNPAYAALMRRLTHELSFGAGIHPSYDTWVDFLLLREQYEALEKVLGRPVTSSRQHYLRYMLPMTFHYLIDSGITEEYSLCPLAGTGFVNGICISYPWFDLHNNEVTSLMLHPSVVMDRGLLNARLSPAQGVEALERIREKVRAVNGDFRIILHNETFSGNAEWKGWTEIYLQLIRSLKETGV